MKKNFYTVMIVEAIVIGLCMFLLCDHFMVKDNSTIIDDTVITPGPVSGTFTITELENAIRENAEFISAKYSFSCEQNYSKSKTIKEIFGFGGDIEILGTNAGFTYKYKGYVNAGVDFSKAKVEKDDNNIKIILPKAEIIGDVGWEIKPQLLDEKKNIFNPLSSDETTKAHENVKEKEKQNAINNGVLEDAEENAEKWINTCLKAFKEPLKDYDVDIVFENN